MTGWSFGRSTTGSRISRRRAPAGKAATIRSAALSSTRGRGPLLPGLHAQAEARIIHPQKSVAAAGHRAANDAAHLLRHHADEHAIIIDIAEAIESDAVLELARLSSLQIFGSPLVRPSRSAA